MTFDPWSTSIDEAINTAKKANENEAIFGPTGQYMQVFAAHDINAMKEDVENGDGFAVLACIAQCVSHGLIAPEWLAQAFNSRFNAVADLQVKSWDAPAAFGLPNMKGTNIKAKRKQRHGIARVYAAIFQALEKNPKTPIGKQLFEEIGKSLGYGTTLTGEYYYEGLRQGLKNPLEIF